MPTRTYTFYRRCDHRYHLIRTLVTCGLWTPIWVWDWLRCWAGYRQKVTTRW